MLGKFSFVLTNLFSRSYQTLDTSVLIEKNTDKGGFPLCFHLRTIIKTTIRSLVSMKLEYQTENQTIHRQIAFSVCLVSTVL